MALSFPNRSRSYDAKRNLVCFWGHEGVVEISFFVEASALHQLKPRTSESEAGYLEVFDAARPQIYETARRAYSRAKKDAYFLAAEDF